MSGFLPDLASWALRGGAAAANEDGEQGGQALASTNNNAALPPVPMTPEELRAQRLARMMQLQQTQSSATGTPVPMEIDDEAQGAVKKPAAAAAAVKKEAKKEASTAEPMQVAVVASVSSPPKQQRTMKKAKNSNEELSPTELSKRLQRKKELLLSKCLQVQLVGSGTNTSDSSGGVGGVQTTLIDTGSAEISVSTVAEILASRLSLEPVSAQQPLVMAYLGAAYNRTSDELRALSSAKKAAPELQELLQEVQRQTVSYAATCLLEPDIFPGMAKNSATQLAVALLRSTTATSPESNLTLGGTNSFYYHVVEELVQQQQSAECVNDTVATMVKYYCTLLAQTDSVLGSCSAGEGGDASPTTVVTALTSVCLHKSAAMAVAELDSFLLPPAGSPQAAALVRPPMPTGANPLQQLLASTDAHRPYTARSGVAVERATVLGLCLRVGAPKHNPAFPYGAVLRQSVQAVDAALRSQRQQLAAHQQTCYQLLMALLKAGAPARTRLLTWFTDALLVNVGASALRPDASKVSGTNLLVNVSVMLLKLCDPFVGDEAKQHLIDAGFVSDPAAHGGVFAATGDDAVPRLGSADSGESSAASPPPYNPKNAFIPQCFFLGAHSLHLGVVPGLQQHENLLRNISHWHYEITNSGRDIHADPRFSTLISRQRSEEVSLFQEEMMEQTLRFCNFTAKVLNDMDDATVATMPEEFVSDICDILLAMGTLKPSLLTCHEFRHVFKLVVKLLSPKYASMVRNYNLRAQLGDVLHDLFLPRPPGSRREVPASVATDPLAGGQTYLLSDAYAQETLAPSLLLLYGEVEHTGYFDKMSHRAKIASLIKYLWESSEHRPAFRRITQNKTSFIKFANGIMNETNTLIATVMQKLPEIREAQEKMKNAEEWGRLSEDEQSQISSRLEDNERDVKSSLPLCNKTLQMFGYLNTDTDIRNLFLLDELCSRLVTMLLHVLTKLVGSKGLDLKVDNPEQYDFRPKEMLRDLCAIFALFAASENFQEECAKSGCDPTLLRSAVKTCRRLKLLEGESMEAFASLPDTVEAAAERVAHDEELLVGAPDEFLDEIMSTFMKDPVILPSGHYVDRSTITQHLLNDPIDPFNREPLTVDQVQPAVELKARMLLWLDEQRVARESGGN